MGGVSIELDDFGFLFLLCLLLGLPKSLGDNLMGETLPVGPVDLLEVGVVLVIGEVLLAVEGDFGFGGEHALFAEDDALSVVPLVATVLEAFDDDAGLVFDAANDALVHALFDVMDVLEAKDDVVDLNIN